MNLNLTTKLLPLYLVIAFALNFYSVSAKEIQRVQTRNGLANFYHKIEMKDTVRVAYFGGSITAAPGWRVKSFKWLQQKYPETTFIQINAAIGGTGSNLGAFRLAKDVLQYNPDLIFMEFVVNDSRTAKADVQRQYEGIIRQTWKSNPFCDLCFVYTLKEDMLETYASKDVPPSLEAAEDIAKYYAIPSVNFAYEVLDRLDKNTLIFTGPKDATSPIPYFSRDGVHPYVETGHQIYFEELKKLMNKLSQQFIKAKKHTIRKPLYKDNWENARILTNDKLRFSGDWENVKSKSYVMETKTQGASFNFSFAGTMFGIYDIIGAQGCKLDIYIDGKQQTSLRFDKYCTYNRANYIFFPGLTDGLHLVEIKLGEPLSVEEKIEILKERTPDAQEFPKNLSNNIFRLKQIMVL